MPEVNQQEELESKSAELSADALENVTGGCAACCHPEAECTRRSKVSAQHHQISDLSVSKLDVMR